MTLTFLGQQTIGGVVPAAVTAQASTDAALLPAIERLQGELAGLLAMLAGMTIGPPSLPETLEGSLQVVASLSVPTPTIPTLQIPNIAAQIAEIEAAIAALLQALGVSASFAAALGTGGISLFAYNGAVASMGAEVQAALSSGLPNGTGPAARADALILASTSVATWSVVGTVFKVA